MENVESLINKKKVFKSGSGVEFNYSFVPAICSKLYSEYVDLSNKVLELYKEVRKPLFKKDDKEERLKKTQEYEKLALETNKVGEKIIELILSRNPQTWKADNLIEFVYTEMSILDMSKFIITAITGDVQEEKKS